MTKRSKSKRPPFKKFFASVDETGEAIGQGRTKIYELIKENKLETVLAGRRRLVVVESIESYVARCGLGRWIMTAVNATAAERGQILTSSRSVNAKVQTLSHYTDNPQFSTFTPIGNVVAEIVLASICKARNVSPPVGRVLMAAHRMGGLSL